MTALSADPVETNDPARLWGRFRSRATTGTAIIAALAVLAAALSLTTLTTETTWVAPAIRIVIAIGAGGVLLRGIGAPAILIGLGQLALALYVSVATCVPDALDRGLPGRDTIPAILAQFVDAAQVIRTSLAPLPTTGGVVLTLCLGVAAIALVVDLLAVTFRAPAAAGVGLLALYLTGTANSGTALPYVYFLISGALWLVLLARANTSSLRRWPTGVTSPDTPTEHLDEQSATIASFASIARITGIVTLVAALALPVVIPHAPTRYILDGIARGGTGGRNASVGFTSSLDLTRSLQSNDRSVVLEYRSDSSSPPPLSVTIPTQYSDGVWRAAVDRPGQPNQAPSVPADSGVTVTDRTITVVTNRLAEPFLAAPYPTLSVTPDSAGVAVTTDSDGTMSATPRPDGYTATWADTAWTPTYLAASPAFPNLGSLRSSYLTVDQASAPAVRAALAQAVTTTKSTPYERAVAIQAWLRDTGNFSYSLTLPPAQSDPVTDFLRSKVGYCVQFSTTMVMMARAAGIPAREVIGFLPGTVDGSTWVVRNSDAHAWPELWFQDAGWVRFEPTPAVRTGLPPGWTVAAPAAPGSAGGSGRAADPEAAPATAAPRNLDGSDPTANAGAGETSLTDQFTGWLVGPWGRAALILLMLAAIAAIVPLTGALVRRADRRRALSDTEQVEVRWRELVADLGDLGLPVPEGESLRRVDEHLGRDAYLDGEARAALSRAVGVLELTRYARVPPAPGGFGQDLATIDTAARTSRRWPVRVRARLLPAYGTRWWAARMAATSSSLRVVPARIARAIRTITRRSGGHSR